MQTESLEKRYAGISEGRDIPIIMLTAKSTIKDLIYGADDCVTKPFCLRETVVKKPF